MKTFTNYWNKALNYGTSQKGVVLVIVTLALVLLTAIITSAHYTIVSQTTSSSSYRLSTQAFYVAEAGTQRAMDWFSHKYNPVPITATTTVYPPKISGSDIVITNINGSSGNYPDSTVRTSFQSYLGLNTASSGTANNFQIITGTSGANSVTGQYIVTATLLSTKQIKVFPGIPKTAEKWRIDSTGRLLNGAVELARADNSTIIETLVTPALGNAVCVKDSFDFNGKAPVDSYDSVKGVYDATTNGKGPANVGSFSAPQGPFDISGSTPSFNGSINIPGTRPERPNICDYASNKCGETTCDVPDTPVFVDTLTYPPTADLNERDRGRPVTPAANSIPFNFASPKYYKAVSCPTGCLTTNDCAPTSTITSNNTTYGDGTGTAFGPIIEKITGQGGNGSKIDLPTTDFEGDACIWINTINFETGTDKGILIDNLSKRRAGTKGALNIFVSNVTSGNRQLINIVSNKDNPVNMYVRSSLTLSGNVNMNTGSVSGATYATQNNQGLKIFGKSKKSDGTPVLPTDTPSAPAITLDSQISGIIYAPRSTLIMNGNTGVFGAVISRTFRKNGNPDGVHYDVQLSKDFVNIFNFVPANQIRKVR